MKSALRIMFTLAAVAAFVLPADAAMVTWSSGPFVNEDSTSGSGLKDVMGTGQFDTSGIQILADNSNGPGAAGVTYDGITYTDSGSAYFTGGYSGFHISNATNDVSRTARTTSSSSGAGTVTLGTGGVGTIVPGNDYRIQLLFMDGRNNQNGRSVELDGLNQGVYGNGDGGATTWGDSLLVTGTFTADAISQIFTVQLFQSGSSKGAQLNALLLHDVTPVPEPSSFLLLGFVTLGLIGVRHPRR